MTVAPRISPFLWFDGRSREAAEFYVSVFPNSRILGDAPSPQPPPPGVRTLSTSPAATLNVTLDGRCVSSSGG